MKHKTPALIWAERIEMLPTTYGLTITGLVIIGVVVVLVLCVASFLLGVYYGFSMGYESRRKDEQVERRMGVRCAATS